jgi:hypothetical protein
MRPMALLVLLLCAVLAALSLCMGPSGFSPGIVWQALRGE